MFRKKNEKNNSCFLVGTEIKPRFELRVFQIIFLFLIFILMVYLVQELMPHIFLFYLFRSLVYFLAAIILFYFIARKFRKKVRLSFEEGAWTASIGRNAYSLVEKD